MKLTFDRRASLAIMLAGASLYACSASNRSSDSNGAGGLPSGGAFGAGGAAPIGGAVGTAGKPPVVGNGGTTPIGGAGFPSSGGATGIAGSPPVNTGGTPPSNGGSTGQGGAAGATGMGGSTGVPDGGKGMLQPVMFSKNVRLNDDTGSGHQSEVALAAGPNGMVLAGWMDERSNRVCAFSFSLDGGMTWSKNVSIANSSGGAFVGDPAVAIDGGGTMYAVCQQYFNPAGYSGEMHMMTSTDKGQSWSAVSTVEKNPDKPWAQGGVQDGTVFVSWLGNPGGIKRSTDHGKTWSTAQSTGNIVHGTAITTSTTGLVHVPYNADADRNQLRYLRSKDNGVTYEKARDLIADMGTFCFSCNPRQHPIVGAGSDPTGKYVAITWASTMSGGEGDDDVWLMYSSDGGDNWTKPIRVNDNKTKSRQFESWVAVDRYGRVHVAWTDYRDGGQNETWYARSVDPTKGFEPNIQVTDGHGSGSTDFLGDYKGIAVQGADVLIVWEDTRRDSGDIYFARAAGAAGP